MKQLKDHTDTKVRTSTSTASSVVKWFIEQVEVPTTFVGEGQYRIYNAANTSNFITFATPTSTENNILLSSNNTGNETVFNVVANVSNPGKYNITTEDGFRFIAAVNGTSPLSRTVSSNDLDDEIAVFDIVRQSANSYSLGITYETTDKYLKDNGSLDVKTGTDTSNNTHRWIFEHIGNLGVNDIQQTNNAVYPVPSSDGVFNLQESAAWSVYAITGSLVAEGNGTKIDLSNAPKGVYILKYNGMSKKIISQ